MTNKYIVCHTTTSYANTFNTTIIAIVIIYKIINVIGRVFSSLVVCFGLADYELFNDIIVKGVSNNLSLTTKKYYFNAYYSL